MLRPQRQAHDFNAERHGHEGLPEIRIIHYGETSRGMGQSAVCRNRECRPVGQVEMEPTANRARIGTRAAAASEPSDDAQVAVAVSMSPRKQSGGNGTRKKVCSTCPHKPYTAYRTVRTRAGTAFRPRARPASAARAADSSDSVLSTLIVNDDPLDAARATDRLDENLRVS
jgi:hypothetical protein